MNKRIKKKKAKQQAQIIYWEPLNQTLINVTDKMIPVIKSMEDACKGITKAINEVDWYRIFKECNENHSDDDN